MTIRHVVIWTLHNPADAPRFKQLLDACADLVPGMLTFDVGLRTDGLEANADVVLVSSFADEAALASYQTHPRHREIGLQLAPLRSQRVVVDWRG